MAQAALQREIYARFMKEALPRAAPGGRKNPVAPCKGPCPGGWKALYQRQFIFSYDPRSESGPERTRSFLLPERGLAEDAARQAVGKVPKRALTF